MRWSYLFGQLIGRLEVDFAVSTPVSPRDIRLGRLSGTPDRLDLGRGLRGRDACGRREHREPLHGTFELTVNWGDACREDNITARTISLEGVCGSTGDWFRHDSRDVETIFLSRIDMDGDAATDPGAFSAADATAPDVRFGYKTSGTEGGDLAGTAANGHSEGPLGVLGT